MKSTPDPALDPSRPRVDVGADRARDWGQPFFIFGAPRSGTSLLSRMINGHPEIGVPFESLLYTSLFDWRSRYGDLRIEANKTRLVQDCLRTYPMQLWTPVLRDVDVMPHFERPDFHGAVEAIMRAWLVTQGKKRWGEKSPWHVYYWPQIIEGFPKSKVVHIVRDGRDSALSWKTARFGPRHVYPLAKKWRKYIQTIGELRTAIGNDRVHELRYEDLLKDPERELRSICAFLDVDYADSMMSFYQNKDPYPTDATNNNNLSRPLIQTNQQKWRSLMSRRELRAFESVAGEVLERYGYERMVPDARLGPWEKARISFVEHPLSRVYGIALNVQGMKEAVRLWTIYAGLYLRRAHAAVGPQS